MIQWNKTTGKITASNIEGLFIEKFQPDPNDYPQYIIWMDNTFVYAPSLSGAKAFCERLVKEGKS